MKTCICGITRMSVKPGSAWGTTSGFTTPTDSTNRSAIGHPTRCTMPRQSREAAKERLFTSRSYVQKSLNEARAYAPFFEHTNSLRTVPRLGVDKFTSQLKTPRACWLLVNLPTLFAWKMRNIHLQGTKTGDFFEMEDVDKQQIMKQTSLTGKTV